MLWEIGPRLQEQVERRSGGLHRCKNMSIQVFKTLHRLVRKELKETVPLIHDREFDGYRLVFVGWLKSKSRGSALT